MLVLGLQGSPRKGGNADTFLSAFMEKAVQAGAVTETIQTAKAGVVPCKGCGYCEKHGTCIIADDPMSEKIYGLLRQADLVVAATPVYFYGVSAQLKVLIDRCQTLWSRKYACKLEDPLANSRQGLLFSVAASRGRQVFDGVHLTAKYFFDAIDARLGQTIAYRGVEAKGAIRKRDGWLADIEAAVEKTVVPSARRPHLLFVSSRGACLAPMAAAMTQKRFGNRIRADFAGRRPAEDLDESMLRFMQEKGVDLGYRRPQSIEQAFAGSPPDRLVVLDEGNDRISFRGLEPVSWVLTSRTAEDDMSLDRVWQELRDNGDQLKQWIE